jgi:HAMP domain-containing protein
MPAAQLRSAEASGRRLAFQLWVCSILCWWGLGIPFSKLWWLVNEKQLDWIFICYAWEVPVLGWTGAVLVPWLLWRRLTDNLAGATHDTLRRLARFPATASLLALGTSTLGYAVGAVQVRRLAALPLAEAVKIVAQGPVLGALLAVAAYFFAERAIRSLALPRGLAASAAPEPGVWHSIYGKVFSITVALILGVAAPLFLYSLTQRQLDAEQNIGRRLEDAVAPARTLRELEGAVSQFGPNAYGFVFRRSNNVVVGGTGTGRVLLGDGQADFAHGLSSGGQGRFAGRDGTHKVVAFNTVPGLLPDGDDAVFVGVVPMSDYGSALVASSDSVLLIGCVSLLLGLALAAMLAHSIVDPLRRLQAAAAQMAAGDLEIDAVGVAGGDEVALLARQFDRMAQRVQADESSLRSAYDALQAAQDRLVQAEKLAAAGRVVSGVAHELNNPLSAVLHFVEDLLADETRPVTDREALTAVSLQARRARKIVRDLLAFVRRREYRGAPADVEQVLRHPRGRGQRAGHHGGGPAAHLRAVLHHQGAGPGHGARPVGLPRDREPVWGHPRGGELSGRGRRCPLLPVAAAESGRAGRRCAGD